MEYNQAIAEFFEKLKDHKTLSGIEITLNKVDSKKRGGTPKPFREKPLRRFEDEETSYIILLRDSLLNYDKEIENVMWSIKDYIDTGKGEINPLRLSTVSEIINRAKNELPRIISKNGPEFNQYKIDIQYLFNTGEFPPESEFKAYLKAHTKSKGKQPTLGTIRQNWLAEYDIETKIETIYNSCLILRLIRRQEIIETMENSIVNLQESFLDTGAEQCTEKELKHNTEKIEKMHKLGIIDLVLSQCKKDDKSQPEWVKASEIISSFTGMKATSIVSNLRQLGTGRKNDPLKPKKKLDADD